MTPKRMSRLAPLAGSYALRRLLRGSAVIALLNVGLVQCCRSDEELLCSPWSGGTGPTACSATGPAVRCLVPGGIACADEAASCFEQGLLGELDRTCDDPHYTGTVIPTHVGIASVITNRLGVIQRSPLETWRSSGAETARCPVLGCFGDCGLEQEPPDLLGYILFEQPSTVFRNCRWDPWGFGS
ncbi:hypothetical protein Taro_010948 [Colocasia esculenta]|uniref:Uncharacterized protein n=1 Tax=Colocasia esculenta TaxID=4460 RepID=A0A843UB58_COLES|nr:hypothetical protein [Colocasia esculenta]